MYNWSLIDEKKMRADDPDGYKLWRMIQMINFGLDGEKLNKSDVKDAWPMIKDRIDPYRRRAMEFLLWGTIYSLPTNLPSWNRQLANQL